VESLEVVDFELAELRDPTFIGPRCQDVYLDRQAFPLFVDRIRSAILPQAIRSADAAFEHAIYPRDRPPIVNLRKS
jgi:hypothetical protein